MKWDIAASSPCTTQGVYSSQDRTVCCVHLKTEVLSWRNSYKEALLPLSNLKRKRTSCLNINKNRGDTQVLDWSVAEGWRESGCSLLPSFTHLVEKFMIWTQYIWTHLLFLVHNCSLHERIPPAPLALFVLSITHTCSTRHRQNGSTITKHGSLHKARPALEFILPLLGCTSIYTYPRLHRGSTAGGGPNHPHLKGDKETAHCACRGPRRSWALSGHPGEQILLPW